MLDVFSKQTHSIDGLTARYCRGMYIWKLENFHALCDDMRKNTTRVETSPGFYTDVFGYRMCLRFNLTIQSPQGAAAVVTSENDASLEYDSSTFVSLYVHFMKGDFDDCISWPFKGELTLTIVNLSNPEESLTECIRTKPDAVAFAKPIHSHKPSHIGIGYPDVAPISKIFSKGFVQNDSLTVKILAKAE